MYTIIALRYLRTFWATGIHTGMTGLSKGSRVQTWLPTQGASGAALTYPPLIHESS